MATVLIVDDLAENLYLLQVSLEAYGYQVVSAPDGAQALAVARAHPPAIIIADILMPVMDGFTLCRQWRQDPVLWKIPFIFYTATYTDPKDEQFALSLGADRFLSKPAEPDVIVQAVQELLNRAPGSAVSTVTEGLAPETVYLREYNEVLIRKLEDKVKELEHANAELRTLDGVKDNLLANVSHELRTPLVAVRGYAEMIYVGRSGPVTDQQREQCGIVLRNVERLLALIDNLLHLAGSETALQCGEFRAGELLGEVQALLAGKAREKGMTIACAGDDVPLYGDRRRLVQALINLVDNGIKFSPSGSTVTVAAEPDAGGARLLVSDTGCGVQAADRQRIFDRFFQADSSSTREHGGLGIGLSIARDIVTRHGGTIGVTANPGGGSTFTIFLPRAA
ncbi:MAG TPA: hybrid sensor histidine kinase/response regulator [bacterium]|nr:hybrid sensor histidine kinase/response regulator [bacterium]